jgi:hypothetical protein
MELDPSRQEKQSHMGNVRALVACMERGVVCVSLVEAIEAKSVPAAKNLASTTELVLQVKKTTYGGLQEHRSIECTATS